MDKLEIKQGSFIQQTQYFIPDSRTELISSGFVCQTGMFRNLWDSPKQISRPMKNCVLNSMSENLFQEAKKSINKVP